MVNNKSNYHINSIFFYLILDIKVKMTVKVQAETQSDLQIKL